MNTIQDFFPHYLGILVSHLEYTHNHPNDRSARNFESTLFHAGEGVFCDFPDGAADSLGLPQPFCDKMAAMIKAREMPSLELAFILLFLRREYAEIIRLQKATEYRDLLVVFSDENHHAADNGVYYSSHMGFADGDQDVVLGLAKKRINDMGLIRGVPIMAVASMHAYRKQWRLKKAVPFW